MGLTKIPTKTADSIGAPVRDRPRPLPRDPRYAESAEEHERLKDAVIELAQAVGLGDGSTEGSLEERIQDIEAGGIDLDDAYHTGRNITMDEGPIVIGGLGDPLLDQVIKISGGGMVVKGGGLEASPETFVAVRGGESAASGNNAGSAELLGGAASGGAHAGPAVIDAGALDGGGNPGTVYIGAQHAGAIESGSGATPWTHDGSLAVTGDAAVTGDVAATGTLRGLTLIVEESGVELALTAADSGKLFRCTHASGCTVPVPDDLPVGFTVAILNQTGGDVDFDIPGDVVFEVADGFVSPPRIDRANGLVVLTIVDVGISGVALVTGDLELEP